MSMKRLTAMAVAVLFAVTSFAYVTGAEEDVPIVITEPAGVEKIPCAVFFADNMVYTPQWRVDNYVRIEVLVIDMTDFPLSTDITRSATDLYDELTADDDEPYEDGEDQQDAILLDSATVLATLKMVSVSYIRVDITSTALDDPIVLEAGWDPETQAKVINEGFGREVNKAGHVIYGTLWDTEGLDAGEYNVSVSLGRVHQDSAGNWYGVVGEWYDVDYSIGHLYNTATEEEGDLLDPEHPYSDLLLGTNPDYIVYKLGIGGLAGDTAWIILGQLIDSGTGGGNGDGGGGDGGGDHENGNGGDGGNNHHGGKALRTRGK